MRVYLKYPSPIDAIGYYDKKQLRDLIVRYSKDERIKDNPMTNKILYDKSCGVYWTINDAVALLKLVGFVKVDKKQYENKLKELILL